MFGKLIEVLSPQPEPFRPADWLEVGQQVVDFMRRPPPPNARGVFSGTPLEDPFFSGKHARLYPELKREWEAGAKAPARVRNMDGSVSTVWWVYLHAPAMSQRLADLVSDIYRDQVHGLGLYPDPVEARYRTRLVRVQQTAYPFGGTQLKGTPFEGLQEKSHVHLLGVASGAFLGAGVPDTFVAVQALWWDRHSKDCRDLWLSLYGAGQGPEMSLPCAHARGGVGALEDMFHDALVEHLKPVNP